MQFDKDKVAINQGRRTVCSISRIEPRRRTRERRLSRPNSGRASPWLDARLAPRWLESFARTPSGRNTRPISSYIFGGPDVSRRGAHDFYTDPRVFSSILRHGRFSPPSWCAIDENAVAHFIKIHRDRLGVAAKTCAWAWIDLTFGHATCGKAAVEAKNVMVRDDVRGNDAIERRCRIFPAPHPKRRRAGEFACTNVEIDRDADDASTAEALRTTTIVEPAFRFVQEQRPSSARSNHRHDIHRRSLPRIERRRLAPSASNIPIGNSLFDRRARARTRTRPSRLGWRACRTRRATSSNC